LYRGYFVLVAILYEAILYEANLLEAILYEAILYKIRYNEKITCQGKDTQIGSTVHKDYMCFSSSKLTISTQHFLVQNNKTIESTTAVEMLPCSPTAGYCQTGLRTYIWDGEFPDCLFVAINISAKPFGTSHLVAEEEQLVLNLTQRARDSRCGLSGHMTNLSGIWVVPATQTGQLALVNKHDVVEEFQLVAGLGYLEYVLMAKTEDQWKTVASSLCNLENCQTAWDSPILLRGNQYLISRGDTYMTFTCPMKTGSLRRSDHCFKQIPLEDGNYMDPTSRLLVKKPEPVSCSQHFPVIVRAEEA
jgi:hypothetical protein